MTKLKRVADGQLNKDAYEAAEEEEEDSRFAYVPDPGRGMTRASEEVLQRRKIIKVSRKSFGLGGAAGSAMAAGASVAPTPSSNPFVLFANLAPPTATSTSAPQEEPPAKPNPFANISFAAPSSAAAAASMAPPSKPTFSFTSSSSSATATNTPTSTLFSFAPTNNATIAPGTKPPTAKSNAFSLAPSNNTTTTTTTSSTTMVGNNNNNAAIKHSNTTTTVLSTPKQQSVNNSGNNNSKIKELNSALAQTIIDHWEGKHYTSDYSCFMKQYQEHVEQLDSEMENNDETLSNTSTSTANGATTTMTTLSSMEGIAPPMEAPSIPSTKPFSFGTTLGGGTTATSSSTSTSWAVSKPAPSFSFGGPPQTAPISHNAVGADNDDDDPTSNPDDGKIDAVLQEENSDEVVLHHVRAKHMKYQDKQWKKYGAGMLRCYRHKISNKHRLVIRNEIGKVQFNVGVSKGMMFDKVTKDGKKGKTAFVKFMAVEDASKGPEQFMLQVKPECLDSLHDILKSMAA